MGVLTWNLKEAVNLVKKIESVCPQAGCHVALTGGCLYKGGERKDLDILFYRIRQSPEIDIEKLLMLLSSVGIEGANGSGWIYKASFKGKNIDMFFPEEQGGEVYQRIPEELKSEIAPNKIPW